MFYPPREHLTPQWLFSKDEQSQIRCERVVRVSDTRWITDPSVLGASRDVPQDRFTPMSRLPESWAADSKRTRDRIRAAKAERFRQNEARVLAVAAAEAEEAAAAEERHLNGLRQQRLEYLQAIAMRTD